MTPGPPGDEPVGSDWTEWFDKLSKEISAVRDLVMRLLHESFGEEAHEAPTIEELELKLKSVLAAQLRGRTTVGRVTRVSQGKSVKEQIDEAAAGLIAKRTRESEFEKRARASVAPRRAREGR